MQSLDVGKTGEITEHEWETKAHAHLKCPVTTKLATSCKMSPTETVCKIFDKLDKDNNDKLDQGEATCLAKAYAAGSSTCEGLCTAIGACS